MTQATYFMKIDNAPDLRRQVLENSKSVIESLQRSEKISDIRADKLNNVVKLKQIMSELFELTSRLRSGLPQPKMSPMIKRNVVKKSSEKAQQIPSIKKSKIAEAPKAKPKGDLDKLESALSDIESKLSRLE